MIPSEFDTSDLSFDDIEEIQQFADGSVSQTNGDLTPGECQMARDHAEAGLPYEEIAELFPVGQRELTLHIDGFCTCDEKRGERR